MTVIIDNLEKQGYVMRLRDSEDRRAILVCITNKGIALMDEMFPKSINAIGELMNVVSMEEKLMLLDILKRVANKAKA